MPEEGVDLNTHKYTYKEYVMPGYFTLADLISIDFHGKTKFQNMEIIQTKPFGKCLVLDNEIQSAEKYEYIYHESLVHPAMLAHPNPKRVFIAGGGEGATAREVIKHKSVEECVMVDIDGECVEWCKKLLKSHHNGALEHPKVKVVIDDAKHYLEEVAKDNYFDVMILDLADPVKGNPCFQLYSTVWYELCMKKMTKDGVLVTQSGCSGIMTHTTVLTPVHHTLKQVYPQVNAYTTTVPSFGDDWGFNIAFQSKEAGKYVNSDTIDKNIEERIEGGHSALKFYDSISHNRVFNLPKGIRESIKKEERVITPNNYVYMPGSY